MYVIKVVLTLYKFHFLFLFDRNSLRDFQIAITVILNFFFLNLKLPGEGQMALPFKLNVKNVPNADFFLIF